MSAASISAITLYIRSCFLFMHPSRMHVLARSGVVHAGLVSRYMTQPDGSMLSGSGLRNVPLGSGCSWLGRVSCLALRQLLAVEVTHNSCHVDLGFVIGWNAVVALHPMWPGVVGCQGFNYIKVVAFQKFAQITRAALNIRARVECIGHTQLRRCLRHQLHQPLRALIGN